MRDLRMRMEQIRKQISRYRSRHEKRLMAGLAAVCTVLSGGIGILLGLKQGPGIFTIQTEYGTVLLHMILRRPLSRGKMRSMCTAEVPWI